LLRYRSRVAHSIPGRRRLESRGTDKNDLAQIPAVIEIEVHVVRDVEIELPIIVVVAEARWFPMPQIATPL